MALPIPEEAPVTRATGLVCFVTSCTLNSSLSAQIASQTISYEISKNEFTLGRGMVVPCPYLTSLVVCFLEIS